MLIVWGTSKAPEINEGLVRFVGSRVEGGERGFGACASMGVIDGERLIAALIFHNYNPESGVLEFSAAAESGRWLTRPVLWAMFNYAFNDCGAQMVVMRVSERNRTWNGRGIQRILKAYSFVETRIERLRNRDTAELIYTLTDTAWASNGFHREHSQEARAAA